MTIRSNARASSGSSGRPRIGYLLSKYPSANHTYLLREVLALRAAELDIVVGAIDADDRPVASIPPVEQGERARTFVVKCQSVSAILAAHAATFATRPVGYARGLATAVRLAGADLYRLAYNILYFAEAVVVGRHFWKAGCTHVHTHYASTVALLAARVYAFDVSATIHGSAEFINPDVQRLREKVQACSFVRAISAYGKSQLMLATPRSEWPKITVIRLGVDPADFSPIEIRADPSPFRLVSVGQLQPAKGFHVLLDALGQLVHDGRDVHLTLVGDGPDAAPLNEHARELGITERVTFAGARAQPEVRRILAASDAFVLASFAEGIPVVLMEAMACGLPCVATRITGVPELIQDGTDGLLVTPSSADDLVAAISRLVDDRSLRADLGAHAQLRIARDYHLDTNVERLVEVFREAVALQVSG